MKADQVSFLVNLAVDGEFNICRSESFTINQAICYLNAFFIL